MEVICHKHAKVLKHASTIAFPMKVNETVQR